MKKILTLLILLMAGGGGAYYWHLQNPLVTGSDIVPEIELQISELFGKQPINENELLLYGNIDIREAQLAFNSSEHITEILVQEGEQVKKGQLLARLSNEVLKAQLQQAKAKRNAQAETIVKLKAGARKEEIEQVRSEYNAALTTYKIALSSYKRTIPLLKKRVISPDDYDKARALSESTKAQAEAVRHSLVLLQSGTRKEDIAIANATLKSLEASVSLVNQQLDNAKLYAPADGIIRNRILEVGSMAFPATPVMTLAFINPVWVRAYLPETALGKVAIGSKAMISTDSYPEKVYEGWVGYISPTSEFTPKTIQTSELRTRLVYSVRIYACNPQNELRLGMPTTVSVDISKPPASQVSGIQNCGNK